MDNIEELKEYFRKLQRVIKNNAEFTFIDVKLIKKIAVDDILCCIIATLPVSYKKIMKQKEGKNLNSVVSYNVLIKIIHRKFFLNNNLYLVQYKRANQVINTILASIEKDILFAEKFAH